jgi:hypothetical protein
MSESDPGDISPFISSCRIPIQTKPTFLKKDKYPNPDPDPKPNSNLKIT